MRAVAVVVVWLLLPSACATGGGRLPEAIDVQPLAEDTAAALTRARDEYERGRGLQAQVELEPVLASQPGLLEAQRLRQDVLRGRGRSAGLYAEASARVAARPDDAEALYLLGRLQQGSEQLRTFERAVELAPRSLWPWMGLAYALRDEDSERSLAIYQRLFAATDGAGAVGVALAQALRLNGRLPEAVAIYEQLAAAAGWAGVGELGLAQTLLAIGGAPDRLRAWVALLKALRLRPFDPGVHALVREMQRMGLVDEQVEQLVDVVREAPERVASFGSVDGALVLAGLLQRGQQPHAALAVLESAGVSARQPAARRQQRRLLLAIGDLDGFLAQLRADLPAAMLADEANQVRGLWLALLQGPWRPEDALADPAAALAFCRALCDAGLLVECEAVAEQALRRHRSAGRDLRAVRDEVRAELAFENAIRRVLYSGYAQVEAPSLDLTLQRLREQSQAILGRDVVGEAVRFSVPMIGEMLDPFRAGLCRHLARYNRHLVLGQRSGGVTEGLMLTRLSVRDLSDDPDQPLPGRCLEVIGNDRDVRSLSGVLGGDLAGVALLSHYVIDYDAVLEWSSGVAERRRIAREDGDALLDDSLPPANSGDLQPFDVGWRFAALSSLQDSELDAAVLDVIRRHERRHLVDSFHYLPFEDNLWRGLGLLFGFGLSASAIEAEMERRAELAALATSPHQDLVLAHVADFLGDADADSPHVAGFGRLGAELVAELQRQGIEAEAARVANWHRLDPGALRRAARSLFAALPGAPAP